MVHIAGSDMAMSEGVAISVIGGFSTYLIHIAKSCDDCAILSHRAGNIDVSI